MKDKLTDLKAELEKLKAVNVVTKNFVEGFNDYISDLFSRELDYDFMTDNNEVKNRLVENSRKMALFEIGLGNDREEDFKYFIISLHLQMEDLINYYFKKKYENFEDFKTSFELYAKNRYQIFYKINYDEFKSKYENLKAAELKGDKDIEKSKRDFHVKYSSLLKQQNPKSIYNSYQEAIDKIEKLGDKTSIQLVDFKKKLSLFEFENQTNSFKNNLRASINILRNVLSHNVDDANTKAKADALLNSKNFIGCKEALKEVYLRVKDTNTVEG